MHRIRTARVVLLLAVLTLGACGDREVEAHQAASTAAARADGGPEASRTAGQGVTHRFEVTLDRPPFQGSHEYTGDIQCMMLGGTWQATFEVPGATGLSGMLVQLKEVPAAGGSTDKLILTVMFGQMDDQSGNFAVIDVHGSEQGRDGRGTVVREGEGAVLRIEGTTHYGARVNAVLRCASVDLMG